MATISLPAQMCVSVFHIEPVEMGFASRSQVSGVSQTRQTLGWFYRGFIEFPPRTHADAAAMDGFLAKWGFGDVLQMGDPVRPVPRGTLRGSPTVSGSHSAGAKSVSIVGTNGATLLAGDRIGIGSRLYTVTDDVTFGSGATAVSIGGGLHGPLVNGTAVVWDRPKTTWRRLAPTGQTYRPVIADGVVIDIEEKWV